MKDQTSFENCLIGATTEYAHTEDDKDFGVIVEITCIDGKADANVIEPDVIDGYVLSAISTVCHTDEPESFIEHNQTAIRIARLAASLALASKRGK